MTEKKEITTIEQGQVPAALMQDVFADAGTGFEHVGQDDIRIPLIKIAQALSPQLKKNKAEYVEGLEEGMVFNSATQKIYKPGTRFVPANYDKAYLEWIPQEKGGGLAGVHGAEILAQTRKDEKGRDMLPNGNEVVTYAQWFGLLLNEDGSVEQAVIPMKGAAHKASRNIMTVLRALSVTTPEGKRFNPPLFFNVVKLETIAETNKANQDYFNWKLTREGSVFDLPNGADLYAMGKALNEAVRQGTVKAAEDIPESSANIDEDIPF